MLVADKRRKEPRTLPRPWDDEKKARRKEGYHRSADGAVQATGLGGMLTATQTRGAVTLG